MNKITVWDVPIRVFHWAFTLSLSLALVIAFTADDESRIFQYHMIFGLTAGFLLVLRLLIGLVGARYSRLRGLMFHPGETIEYLIKAPIGRARRYVGHNPGTAAVALLMFGLVAGLIWSGLSMNSEPAKEVHEALAFALIAAVTVHLLGLLLHAWHHRENIFLSMITGNKTGEASAALNSPQRLAGLATLAVCVLWVATLLRGYDPANAAVNVPGLGTVTLGEAETEREDAHEYRKDERHERDEDDD